MAKAITQLYLGLQLEFRVYGVLFWGLGFCWSLTLLVFWLGIVFPLSLEGLNLSGD